MLGRVKCKSLNNYELKSSHEHGNIEIWDVKKNLMNVVGLFFCSLKCQLVKK